MTELGWEEPTGFPEDASRDRLIGDWHVYQRRGGHRTSTDDVLTAWFAVARQQTAPARYLDLGCGIGSVLLMTVHRLRPAYAVGVEAQPQSVAMLERTLAELPEPRPRVELVHSDFRVLALPVGPFELITGSPPYFPLSDGILPSDPQRRACRFEARGGVEAYCETAARFLSDTGRFILVFQTTWDGRVLDAARSAGLHLTARADLLMRVDRTQPFLSFYEFRRAESPVETWSFAIRGTDGEITPEYAKARALLGAG